MDQPTQRINYLLRSHLFKLSHFHCFVCHTKTQPKWYVSWLNCCNHICVPICYPHHCLCHIGASIWRIVWLVQLTHQIDCLPKTQTICLHTNIKNTHNYHTGECTHQIPTYHSHHYSWAIVSSNYNQKAIQIQWRQLTTSTQSITSHPIINTHYDQHDSYQQTNNTLHALCFIRTASYHLGL